MRKYQAPISHTSYNIINELGKKTATIEKISIKNFNDYSFFDKKSVENLYNKNMNDITLLVGKNNENYLTIIENIEKNNNIIDNQSYTKFAYETTVGLKDNIYVSYDAYLQNKYNVKINQQTLDRVKNYFR